MKNMFTFRQKCIDEIPTLKNECKSYKYEKTIDVCHFPAETVKDRWCNQTLTLSASLTDLMY